MSVSVFALIIFALGWIAGFASGAVCCGGGGSPTGRAEHRFSGLDVGELQQTYTALTMARASGIFSPGPGNLLPRLADECAGALDRAIDRTQPPTTPSGERSRTAADGGGS